MTATRTATTGSVGGGLFASATLEPGERISKHDMAAYVRGSPPMRPWVTGRLYLTERRVIYCPLRPLSLFALIWNPVIIPIGSVHECKTGVFAIIYHSAEVETGDALHGFYWNSSKKAEEWTAAIRSAARSE